MKKINCILLVDDSISTNFYNKKLIEMSGIANEIYTVNDGLEALNYLTSKEDYAKIDYPRPNVIFLDINMPKMDGFEFLEEYAMLPEKKRSDILVAFLTTSNWEKDKIKAFENKDLIHDFLEKPLQEKDLIKIYDYYMNEPKFA